MESMSGSSTEHSSNGENQISGSVAPQQAQGSYPGRSETSVPSNRETISGSQYSVNDMNSVYPKSIAQSISSGRGPTGSQSTDSTSRETHRPVMSEEDGTYMKVRENEDDDSTDLQKVYGNQLENKMEAMQLTGSLDCDIRCPYDKCEGKFPTPQTFATHVLKHHHDPHHVVCDAKGCGATFCTTPELMDHYRQSHGGPKNMISCHECGSIFANPSDHHKHVLKDHVADKCKCPLQGCCASFSAVEELENHIHQAHKALNEHVSCDLENCGAKFPTTKELINHVRRWHYGVSNRVICHYQKCGAPCPDAMTLCEHFNTYHIAPYRCPSADCHARFDTEEQFINHLRKCMK